MNTKHQKHQRSRGTRETVATSDGTRLAGAAWYTGAGVLIATAIGRLSRARTSSCAHVPGWVPVGTHASTGCGE